MCFHVDHCSWLVIIFAIAASMERNPVNKKNEWDIFAFGARSLLCRPPKKQQGYVLGGLRAPFCNKAAKRRDTARNLLESLPEFMRSEGTDLFRVRLLQRGGLSACGWPNEFHSRKAFPGGAAAAASGPLVCCGSRLHHQVMLWMHSRHSLLRHTCPQGTFKGTVATNEK